MSDRATPTPSPREAPAGDGPASEAPSALDAIDGESVTSLAGRIGATELHAFARVASTMDVAHALAARGAPPGTVVLADAQTRGRGRGGHRWESPPGAGVWLTLLERPTDAAALAVLSLRLGLEAAAALQPLAAGPIRLKWPNDLYVGTGKLAGVLVEARWRDGRPEWVAIGFGLNLRADGAPAGACALGGTAPRAAVLAALVPALRTAAGRSGPLADDECAAFAARDLAAGREVLEPAPGRVLGVARDGALRLATSTGETRVRHGSLRFTDGR